MERFFDNIEVERAFAVWFFMAHDNGDGSYNNTYARTIITYRGNRRSWPFPPNFVEVSRKSETLDDKYPANIRMVNEFLKKYGVSIYEKTEYLVDNIAFSNRQDAEATLKDIFQKRAINDRYGYTTYQIEFKIFYRTVLDVSCQLAETLKTACRVGLLKAQFYSGYSFFQRVRRNSTVKDLQRCLESSDIGVGCGFHYEVSKTNIGYFDHIGQEDENYISYSGYGLKDLQSDDECCGLGFAIAELFLEKQGIDIESGILEQKIDVSKLWIAGNNYVTVFQVDNGKKNIPRELRDW